MPIKISVAFFTGVEKQLQNHTEPQKTLHSQNNLQEPKRWKHDTSWFEATVMRCLRTGTRSEMCPQVTLSWRGHHRALSHLDGMAQPTTSLSRVTAVGLLGVCCASTALTNGALTGSWGSFLQGPSRQLESTPGFFSHGSRQSRPDPVWSTQRSRKILNFCFFDHLVVLR